MSDELRKELVLGLKASTICVGSNSTVKKFDENLHLITIRENSKRVIALNYPYNDNSISGFKTTFQTASRFISGFVLYDKDDLQIVRCT